MPSVNLRFKVTVRSKVNLVHFKEKSTLFHDICTFCHENVTKQLIVHIEWPRSLPQGLN